MTDLRTQKKWDAAARTFDFMNGRGPEERWRPHKMKLFAGMEGKILFLAVGTGLDIACFPPGKEITAIDISHKMLEKAGPKAATYDGKITLRQMDVHDMDFPDASFDQVYTSCTFCSVPDPVRGLSALRRVLKPGGWLRMFEHTGSQRQPFKLLMNLLNPVVRMTGPEINRDTVANVRAAGFHVVRVDNIYLDIVKTIEATVPARP